MSEPRADEAIARVRQTFTHKPRVAATTLVIAFGATSAPALRPSDQTLMTGRFGPLTAFEGALAVPPGAGFGTFITSSTTRGAADPSAVDPGTATAKCAHTQGALWARTH